MNVMMYIKLLLMFIIIIIDTVSIGFCAIDRHIDLYY